MLDIEEPPTKLSRMENAEGGSLDEGQEEWLSEGLTDDDNQQTNHDASANTSQDSSINPASPSIIKTSAKSSVQESLQTEFEDQLDEFLIRKTDKNEESDLDESTKQSNDDGNDTDDLLRMLGDEVNDKNRVNDHTNSDDDDDFVFGNAKQKQKLGKSLMKATKAEPEESSEDDMSGANAKQKQKLGKSLMKATKAEPEESSEDDMSGASSDESLVKKMFHNKVRNVASKSTTKPSASGLAKKTVTNIKTHNASPAPKGFMDKKSHSKSLLKPLKPEPKIAEKPQIKKEDPPPKKQDSKKGKIEQNSDYEETLDEDFEYDEGLMDLSERRDKLTMMKPERMDEDFLTDDESLSGDDDSIYDELPTSDSEMDDWFDLDLRAERAGDYIPLLGDKAHKLLLEEKARVTERVTELRRTLSTLAKTGREQAEALQKATLTLAELDTMLKSA